LLCIAATVAAQENQKILKVYDWKDVSAQIPNSQIVSMDGMSVLKIENTNDAPLEVSLLTITNSSLIHKASTIEWEMKYENVRYSSTSTRLWANLRFFEIFPPQAAGGDNLTNYQDDYFKDTKNWDKYDFGLRHAPYDNQTRSDELRLKFFFQSSGTIYLRPVKLLGVASGGWWSAKQGAMVGGAVGIFGGIIGCFGGVLGCLAGFGKARKFVLTTTKIFIALGMFLTIAGIVAIACGQPFFVWYIFLLPGVMLTLIFSLNFPLIQRRYDDLEIRRMASIDAMGS
jgi:hypothetical protein